LPERVVIRNTQSPGDIVILSAAVRDLCRAHPRRFAFSMDLSCPAVFHSNPNVVGFSKGAGRCVVAQYPGIHRSNQRRDHFIWSFIDDLNGKLKASAVLTEFKPDLHLTSQEQRDPIVPPPYWVFLSGGKRDYTAKWWVPQYWQKVVDMMSPWTKMVQLGASAHVHPKITGTHDMVGKTSLREMMRIVYHSEGVICVVTAAMTMAAAFNKPCVVISGGREPWWWQAFTQENRLVQMRRGIPDWKPPDPDNFVPHQFLHTIGALDCCKAGGCWRSRIEKSGNQCRKPVQVGGVTVPECLRRITPEHVVQAAQWYYDQGILSHGKPIAKMISVPVLNPTPAPAPAVSAARARPLPPPEPEPIAPEARPVLYWVVADLAAGLDALVRVGGVAVVRGAEAKAACEARKIPFVEAQPGLRGFVEAARGHDAPGVPVLAGVPDCPPHEIIDAFQAAALAMRGTERWALGRVDWDWSEAPEAESHPYLPQRRILYSLWPHLFMAPRAVLAELVREPGELDTVELALRLRRCGAKLRDAGIVMEWPCRG